MAKRKQVRGIAVVIDLAIDQELGWLYFPRWNPKQQTVEILRTRMVRAGTVKRENPEVMWSGAAPAGHPIDGMHYLVVDGALTGHMPPA